MQYRLATLQAQIDAETAILQKSIKHAQRVLESKATLVGIKDTFIREKKLYEAKATAKAAYTKAQS